MASSRTRVIYTGANYSKRKGRPISNIRISEVKKSTNHSCGVWNFYTYRVIIPLTRSNLKGSIGRVGEVV